MSKVYSPWSIREPYLKQLLQGLNRVKENLHTQMADLQSKKPRGKADEALLLEIERLESSLLVSRDDLVGRDSCQCLRF